MDVLLILEVAASFGGILFDNDLWLAVLVFVVKVVALDPQVGDMVHVSVHLWDWLHLYNQNISMQLNISGNSCMKITKCIFTYHFIESMAIKKISGYDIYLGKKLGEGAYGSVYIAESTIDKKQCAVKIISKKNIDSDAYLKNALLSEIKILQTLNSPNIVRLYDVMESTQNYYLIQELCNEGDFSDLLKKQKTIPEKQAIEYLTQTCNGFLALVREGIIHRDLKPANLLLSKGKIKIGDFGFAKRNAHNRIKNHSAVGTPLYSSIQLLKQEPYTSKADIWALGFIFYEMLHGKTPWTANSPYKLIVNVEKNPLVMNEDLAPNTKDFLKKVLQKTEKDRISWDELFVHPIFEGYFDKYKEDKGKFENKLKKVMGDLRFKINQQNINLRKLLETLGFQPNQELSQHTFQKFIKLINPDITNEEETYFFEKMDANNDGSVSLRELEEQMGKNHINVSQNMAFLLKKIGSFGQEVIHEQPLDPKQQQATVSSEIQAKAHKCFMRLHKILKLKKLTLYNVYSAYDRDKSGQLELKQFAQMLKRLDSSFTQEQVQEVFNFLDTDRSKSLEFVELNKYYCKVNEIPEVQDLPPEYYYMEMEKKKNLRNKEMKASDE